MGKIFLLISTVLLSTTGFGASVSYNLEKLSSHTATELDQLGGDLALAMNQLQHCTRAQRDTFNFGYQLTELTITKSSNGDSVTRLKGVGAGPMPSGIPYKVDMQVVAKVVKRPGPPPMDAPAPRKYTCTL